MAVRVETTAYGAPALETLRRVVGDLKGDDPMAAVRIIAPNNLAAIVARRHLARGVNPGGLNGGGRGIAGIEMTTLARLAERLAAHTLAPRTPATQPVMSAAWRQALGEAPGVFEEVADHPATIEALSSAHRELRDISQSALGDVSATTSISSDLVALHTAVSAQIEGSWYDQTDLLNAAAELLNGGSTGAPGVSVLYLPQRLTQAETRLTRALADAGELVVIVALTGASRADEAILGGLTRLGVSPAGGPWVGTATQVFNASDSDDETRLVVRDLVHTLKATPANRIAVLFAGASPYARLLHEHLASAGIKVNGTGTRAVHERAVARTLLEVLALVDHDVRRADLFRALANAPTRDFSGSRIPVARWERISRTAGVSGGDDWAHRLEDHISNLRIEITNEEAAEDPRQWLIERCARAAEVALTLRDFVGRLRDELSCAAAMTTWAELGPWCLELFTQLIGDGASLSKLPPEEQYAAASITNLLRALTDLGQIAGSTSLSTLRQTLDLELASSLPRVGRFGDGVLVAPISAAIGLDFDVVYIVGLSEDIYPGRLQDDALLPERARQASNGELRSQRDRLHADYRHLLAAFACASQRVVASFPRGDLRRSSRRLPSRWLLPTLRKLSGDKALSATKWQEPATYADALVMAGSFAGELLRTQLVSTEQEWRTRQAAAAGQLDDAIVVAGVEMARGRASDTLTRYDGNLAGVDGLPDYAREERLISPTALEKYAGCPHAFFVERLLGVKALERPEDIVAISPMNIGNLVHASMDDLICEFSDSLPGYGERWTDVQHARLVGITSTNAKDFQRRGLTGHPRLWEGEQRRILADMDWLIDDDDRWRATVGARVAASEMPFGLKGQPAVPVAITGGRVLMRGSADKIDMGADGTIFVTDLKAGSDRGFKDITQDAPFAGGTKLQLPIYAYAARQRYGDPTTAVHATYWFVRRDRGRRGIDLTLETEEEYAETIGVLVRSIAAGLFPPKSPETADFGWVKCEYCNPDGIGHADNRERWVRKRHDPVLRELVTLVEPGALIAEDV